MNRLVMWILTGLVFLIGCASPESGTGDEFRQRIDQQLPAWMERYDVPGVSVAVIREGIIVWSDGFGFSDQEGQTPMTSQTMCRVESISKSVTARGVLKLAEQGKIDLDNPVAGYLTSWEFPDTEEKFQEITIRRLLSHSAGLPLGTLGLEYAPGESKPTLRESLSKEVEIIREPGSSFVYSNVGYHLLELLIEEVTGQTFSEYMKQEILLPLGMGNSDFRWREDFITSVPDGHSLSGESVPVYVYAEKAAGGLFSTAEDIARFAASGMLNDFYTSGNVLSEETLRRLYTPVIETSVPYAFVSEYYGLGHFIEILPGGEHAVFGGGQGNGWMTHFHLVPEGGDGIVILTNSSRSWPLIAKILSEWAASNGYGSPGMELILTATSILWVIIFGIGAVILWFALLAICRGDRKWRSGDRNYAWLDYVSLASSLILILWLIWLQTREYLFLKAVFPGATGWLMFVLWMAAVILILPALFPKTSSGTKTAET